MIKKIKITLLKESVIFVGGLLKGANFLIKGLFSFKRGERGKIDEEIYPTIM